MIVLLIWGVISFVIGCCGGGKYILNNKAVFWCFAIFGMVPGAIAGENSDFGSIMTFIYAPGTAVLLGIVVAIGGSMRQSFQNRPVKNQKEGFTSTPASTVSAKTEPPVKKAISDQRANTHQETVQSVGKETILCPVCKSPNPVTATKCTNCSFTELSRTFISTEDASDWFEKVVIPHRIKWEQTKSQPIFHTADELYAQMAALQSKGISSHINEKANDFNTNDYRDGVEIVRYNGNSSCVVIPNEINGKPVLRLGNSLFENCKWLTEVTLPNSLTAIGSKTFYATGITHIVFPNSLVEIGAQAFSFSALTEVIFPHSIKVIPKDVCSFCKKLHTVIILGATDIKENAFSFGESITRLALPDTLKHIEDGAFSCCHSLSKIILPASVQSVYGDFCGSLRSSIIVLNDNIVWRPVKSRSAVTPNLTIYCNPGSTSQQHARDWGMTMKLLSEYQC